MKFLNLHPDNSHSLKKDRKSMHQETTTFLSRVRRIKQRHLTLIYIHQLKLAAKSKDDGTSV